MPFGTRPRPQSAQDPRPPIDRTSAKANAGVNGRIVMPSGPYTLRRLAGAACLFLLPPAALAQDEIAENWDKVTAEDVRFGSGGVEIAGSLYSPVGDPQAALVLVHGSDATGRMSDFARLFATKGFAVLTYDKRGSGESGGALPGPYNVSPENLELLADDAAAAMAWLAHRPELAGVAAGYFGVSQAGWVAPQAAARTPETDFLVMWSATAMTVADELEAGLAEGENAGNEPEIRTIVEQLRRDGTDPDPSEAIAAFGKPSLWIYGTEDAVVPVPLALAVLEPLAAGDHPEITVVMNEDGEHNLDLQHDRGIFEGIVEWMLAQADAG